MSDDVYSKTVLLDCSYTHVHFHLCIHMNTLLWWWLVMAELVVVEIPLGVVAWGAVANLFYISSLAALIWRIVAFLINFLAWIVLVYFVDPETAHASTARSRGDAYERAHNAYFVVPMLVHVLVVTLWIAFRSQFAGLSPLSFFVNLDAFGVFRSVEIVGLFLFVAIMGFWFYESRHARLHVRISGFAKTQQQQKSSSGIQT